MDGIQLLQGCRATSRRQLTFYHSVLKINLYYFNQPQEDERQIPPWSHPVGLDLRPLYWESSALTTRPLLHKDLSHNFKFNIYWYFEKSLETREGEIKNI